MSAMTCEQWQRAIAVDALGGLEPDERAGLLAHLDGCAACREVDRELRETAGVLALVDRDTVGETARVPRRADRARARGAARGRARRTSSTPRARWRRWWAASVRSPPRSPSCSCSASPAPTGGVAHRGALGLGPATRDGRAHEPTPGAPRSRFAERGLPAGGVYEVAMRTSVGPLVVDGSFGPADGRAVAVADVLLRPDAPDHRDPGHRTPPAPRCSSPVAAPGTVLVARQAEPSAIAAMPATVRSMFVEHPRHPLVHDLLAAFGRRLDRRAERVASGVQHHGVRQASSRPSADATRERPRRRRRIGSSRRPRNTRGGSAVDDRGARRPGERPVLVAPLDHRADARCVAVEERRLGELVEKRAGVRRVAHEGPERLGGRRDADAHRARRGQGRRRATARRYPRPRCPRQRTTLMERGPDRGVTNGRIDDAAASRPDDWTELADRRHHDAARPQRAQVSDGHAPPMSSHVLQGGAAAGRRGWRSSPCSSSASR